MARQTSIEVYRKIKQEGILGKRRWEVYDILFRKGPMTANEAFREIAIEKGKNAGTLLSVSNARFTELRDGGVVIETQKRICRVSNRKVLEWDVTDHMPVDRTKAKRKRRHVWVDVDMFGDVHAVSLKPKEGWTRFVEERQ